tara:strand:+ start:914 stop:2062 length:1149 start_codon:yes stop_codon:yes gene_type:complete
LRSDFLPFSKPSISEDDINAVNKVLRSGWITTGPKVSEFEKMFCDFIGCREAVALTSATAGLHLILKALDIGPGDEVITPSLTWVSTINMIVLCGATPIFVDVDKDTLMITAENIEKVISEKTKLIIPVHYTGAPADMKPISLVSKSKKIPVIWDAAHAAGTMYNGKFVGSEGTSIFSFHPIKNITTGEGGMICSDDEELICKIRRLKFHGLGTDAYDRKIQGRSPQAQVIEPGYKYNMTDISAVLGIQQLVKLEMFNKKRTIIAEEYLDKFSDIDEIVPLSYPASISIKHSWHLFVVRLNVESDMTRDMFMYKLKEKNIGTGIHFLPVHQQKYYAETLSSKNIILPNTEWNGDRILSLPLFPDMTHRDIDDVVETIKDILK